MAIITSSCADHRRIARDRRGAGPALVADPDRSDRAGQPIASWSIVTKAFRENLEWAVLVPGDGETTPAVAQLLKEISARGITIRGDQ